MPTLTSSAVRQLSDGNSNGTVLGQSASDPIAFYNQTPVTQPTDPGQATLPASGTSSGAGALTHYSSTQSPASVATITVAEQSVTVTGLLATDLVIVNKPTTDAGLGLCAGRVSAANTLKLVFANPTAGTLTPTGSEAYIVTTIPASLQLSATLSPAAVAAATVVEQTFTGITGLSPGMIVQVNKPTTQAGLGVLTARVTANNTLAITFINPTAAVITPTASEVYIVSGFNALLPASQIIQHGVNVGTLGSVATITVAEQSVTVAGVAATDVMVGMSKPTTQAGLGLVSGRVSGASTIKVTFVNPTAGTLTPTGSEVYGVTVFRPSPTAPMSLFTTAALTPGSVAANTSAEQTFTVTGLTSGQPAVAIPNYNVSATPGVGIAGCRVSATNTLAVTFINATTTAIVPPAGTWTVAQFNQTTPTAGNFVQLLVSPLQTLGMSLVGKVRSALVSLGLILGS